MVRIMSAIRSRIIRHLPQPLIMVARRLLRRPHIDTFSEDISTIEKSGIFDAEWYLARYSGAARHDTSPIAHYLKYGANEGKDPCPLFNTHFYVKKNPHVASARINPLVHFCGFGSWKLRDPSPDFNSTWYWLTYLAQSDSEANPLAHYLRVGKKEGFEIRASDGLSPKDKQSLIDVCEQLLQREYDNARTLGRIGIALTRLSQWEAAEKALREAVALDWTDPHAHERLARALIKQRKWWQVIESLEHATKLDPTHANWFYHLGEAQEKMNRFAQAAGNYRRAIDINSKHVAWHYRLAHAYEKSGQSQAAEQAYADCLRLDKRKEVKRFGIGMLHQLSGNWPEAANVYAKELKRKPLDAELHFKYGMACDRCYSWADAESAYRQAIALKPDTPYWHYRCGFVLERQGLLRKAASAYATAAATNVSRMPYWYYRLGYVLSQAGKHEQACLAYIQTRDEQTLSGALYHSDPTTSEPDTINSNPAGEPKPDGNPAWEQVEAFLARLPGEEDLIRQALAYDTTQSHWHYRLGVLCELNEDWNGAASAYANAVSRSNQYRSTWFYRLGFALFRTGRFEDACHAFCETLVFRRPYGLDKTAYPKSPAQKASMEYNEYLETLPVRGKHVLYESMHGTSIGGNPYAIFEYLVEHDDYADWTHVWVLSRGLKIPPDLQGLGNVIFVERQSDLYRRYLATASHLISDVTFPYWFIRRPEQKYLNTWHGTPLKKLGKDIPGEFMVHGNIQRNLLQTTHLISPNRHTSDVLMHGYDVAGIISAKLAETGYPRIDRTLRATEEDRSAIRKQLDIHGHKPLVLYAPTWRGEHGHPEFDIERLQNDIAALSDLPCQLVFRGHHMIESLLDDLDLPVTIARQDMDTSDVLAVTDILITDYSSIFFDFLPLHRPIIHYCYDWEKYAGKRGLYFDIHSMPGCFCDDLDAVIAHISTQLSSTGAIGTDHAKAIKNFCPHEDGNASKKVVDFFFRNDDSHVVNRYIDSRRSLLFFAGHFTPNGITSSFLNLISPLIDLQQDQLSVILDRDRICADPGRRGKFDELPAAVGRLPRVGDMVQSPEEHWVKRKFTTWRNLPDEAMWAVMRNAYQKELARLIGDARVDALINFEGYSSFWTAAFGLGASKATNISYLHNDMIEEMKVRHPYLTSLFRIHRYYDRLASVSDHMCEINREKMGAGFGLDPSLFTSCINTIDAEELRSRASEELDEDLEPWLAAPFCFLTMGRMSPEKDHAKLLDAFASVSNCCPDARLVILGDGPLREQLHAKVFAMGLENVVLLAGQRNNPFPALARCTCFVLPSNHEGQPMVLLEAMTLQRPIIATDIDGNRGVLKDDYGTLVDNSVEGIRRGLDAFIAGKTSNCEFDPDSYRKKALRQFHAMLDSSVETNSDNTDCQPTQTVN